MYPTINGMLPEYVTVRRGLQGYRAIVMTFDNESQEYKITKRDPSTYADRADALTRAGKVATASGLQVVE
jgi:hypothetical protein